MEGSKRITGITERSLGGYQATFVGEGGEPCTDTAMTLAVLRRYLYSRGFSKRAISTAVKSAALRAGTSH